MKAISQWEYCQLVEFVRAVLRESGTRTYVIVGRKELTATLAARFHYVTRAGGRKKSDGLIRHRRCLRRVISLTQPVFRHNLAGKLQPYSCGGNVKANDMVSKVTLKWLSGSPFREGSDRYKEAHRRHLDMKASTLIGHLE